MKMGDIKYGEWRKEDNKMSWIKKWLEKLAEANEKNFGGQPPDCCGSMKTHPKPVTQAPKNVKAQKK